MAAFPEGSGLQGWAGPAADPPCGSYPKWAAQASLPGLQGDAPHSPSAVRNGMFAGPESFPFTQGTMIYVLQLCPPVTVRSCKMSLHKSKKEIDPLQRWIVLIPGSEFRVELACESLQLL